MEITINLKVDVALGEATLQILGALLPRATGQPETSKEAEDSQQESFSKSEGVENQLHASSDALDLSDEGMRQEVKAAKDRVGADPIKRLAREFGVRSSVDVPGERREEFVKRLRSM